MPLPRVAVLVEGFAVARLGHQLPLAVPVFRERGVVAGPGFRVRQDPVCLHELAELLFVGRLRVIRVELLGQVAEDALNRVFVRTRADLEQLVVIDETRGRPRRTLPIRGGAAAVFGVSGSSKYSSPSEDVKEFPARVSAPRARLFPGARV